MEEYLKRAKELKESVAGNYEHSTKIQDEELVDWLIEQAKKIEQYEKALLKIVITPEDSYNSFEEAYVETVRVALEVLNIEE